MQACPPGCPTLLLPLPEPFGFQLVHVSPGPPSPGAYQLEAPASPRPATPSPVRRQKHGPGTPSPSRRREGHASGTPSPSRRHEGRAIASPRRLEAGRIRATGRSWKCPVCCETVTDWSARLCPRCKGATRPTRPQESLLSPDSPLAREWMCASCHKSNFGWRTACGVCGCAKC